MAMPGLVHFLHGRESGPWGSKIRTLAAIASARGWQVQCLDYSLTLDPAKRLDLLLDAVTGSGDRLVLVGSSMGGWVAAQAAGRLRAEGVFLLAPALHLPGYPAACGAIPTAELEIVHGWDDDVIPCDDSIRFAREHRYKLHLVTGGHRLEGDIAYLSHLFDAFLVRCQAQSIA